MCTGPWTVSNGTLRLTLDAQRLRLPYGARVSIVMQNALPVLDDALHGTRNLRGWGVRHIQ